MDKTIETITIGNRKFEIMARESKDETYEFYNFSAVETGISKKVFGGDVRVERCKMHVTVGGEWNTWKMSYSSGGNEYVEQQVIMQVMTKAMHKMDELQAEVREKEYKNM